MSYNKFVQVAIPFRVQHQYLLLWYSILLTSNISNFRIASADEVDIQSFEPRVV